MAINGVGLFAACNSTNRQILLEHVINLFEVQQRNPKHTERMKEATESAAAQKVTNDIVAVPMRLALPSGRF